MINYLNMLAVTKENGVHESRITRFQRKKDFCSLVASSFHLNLSYFYLQYILNESSISFP